MTTGPPPAPRPGSTRFQAPPPRAGAARFGKYEVEGQLGKGGMGTVYRARDTVLQRPVALKLLSARQTEVALARFEREARTVAALRHPGIVTLLDAGEEGGVPYLVMELVDGEPLAAAIRRGIPPGDAARIVRQVAEALAHAHAAGIIHRDVTPGNIFLDRAGQARLGDFGIAKSERLEGDATRLSRTGAVVGTPSYMAPEVLAGGAATTSSDVYSLGVVLYEAMTRQLPHVAESVIELVSRISAEAPAAPSSVAAEIPEALSSICLKALDRDPKRRYASAQEMADDLARVGEGPKAGFLLRELAANKLRSSLALMGLAGSTASVLVLVSLALGARHVATAMFEKTPGIFVIQRSAIPHFSRVPAGLEEKIQAVSGVAVADPEVWVVAFDVEHSPALFGAVNAPTLAGVDPAKHAKLSGGGVFARSLVAGRPLAPGDANGILIATPFARYHKKQLGDTINVLGRDFVVKGIFSTGSALWDAFLVAHEQAVHEIAQIGSASTSFYFIEARPDVDRTELSNRIGPAMPPTLESGTTEDWRQGGLDFVGGFDVFVEFFGVAVGLLGALAVGNAMILSVRERARELRILRSTRGRSVVLVTVLVESLILGAAGALLGVVLGGLAGLLAAAVLPLTPSTPIMLFVGSFAFGTLLGGLGGLWPALAAVRTPGK